MVVVRAAATDDNDVDQEEDDVKLPPGCSRYSIKVKRPLGLVLEEDKQGNIFVAEVIEDGNAAKTGLVNGDQLLFVSAVVFNKTNDYGGVQESWRGNHQVHDSRREVRHGDGSDRNQPVAEARHPRLPEVSEHLTIFAIR